MTVTTILPREREIELATSAAPADIGAHATVYVYTSKGYEKARDGTNGFTCLVNRDSELDGYHMFKPTCWDAHGSATIVPAILEFAKMIASGQTVADVTSALRQQLKDGTLKPFEKVGIAYMLQGDVSHYDAATGTILQRAFPPHVMIYAPTISWSDLAMSGRAANADERAAIIYQSALGYRYLVVRVPRTDVR